MADPDLMARLQEAAEVIADRARELSGAWSEGIPPTIHTVTADGADSVIIAAGSPYAITFEAPGAPWWKHPVFATGPRETWHWVKQIPRRFMLPAANESGDKCAKVIAEVIDDWLIPLGFHEE